MEVCWVFFRLVRKVKCMGRVMCLLVWFLGLVMW